MCQEVVNEIAGPTISAEELFILQRISQADQEIGTAFQPRDCIPFSGLQPPTQDLNRQRAQCCLINLGLVVAATREEALG